jgi:lipopolysaccharide biosynthesis glycosyltransferase
MPEKAIHITLAFDDNFWAPAYAVIRSVCLFSQRRSDLVFHLMHQTLTQEHKVDIAAVEHEFGVTLKWYDLDKSPIFKELAGSLPSSSRLPVIAFGRLFLDHLLPAEVERVIYLDSDVLVRDDIATLYEFDLEGQPIGAVRDAGGAWIVAGRDAREKRDLFDVADPYFNSGVLLIDRAKWREADVVKAVYDAHETGLIKRLYYDQDLLNLVFRNRWARLPWRWNTLDPRKIHEPQDPAILHYTGTDKPWLIAVGMKRNVAYARFYRHVMTNELFYKFFRHRVKRWWRKKLRLA